jgi:CheY-like chemotaxis protein/PAS domain-containing protein
MSDERVQFYFQIIQQRMAALPREDVKAWQEINAALEDLLLIYEQMQTSLEATATVEEELLWQNQQLAERYHHYYDLFYSSPIAYAIVDASGLILEANAAIAKLLNVPQRYLPGKPLSVYVPEENRRDFRIKLSQLSQSNSILVWQTSFCPRRDTPVAVELYFHTFCSDADSLENLRIGIYVMSQSQETAAQQDRRLNPEEIGAQKKISVPQLPQSLDGLQVLVVDDEADVREFIAAILEPHGIGVRSVSSADAALEELEQFHPDVLVSDLRMPDRDGYSLIRQIRALEAERGGHIRAAAITAYLDEDREKALNAGFEAHLHKLAQPIELVNIVAQLAKRDR